MEEATYFLGVDGGGTGCRARLADETGHIIGEGRAGPASLRFGVETAWQSVLTAAQEAMRAAGVDERQRIFAVAGLAGISRNGALAALQAMPHPFSQMSYTSDSRVACLGAHGGADGGIVSVGTGSIAFAITGGQDIRIGGFGIPVSDEGSGADIGVAAIRLLLRERDGRVKRTEFTEALKAVTGGTVAAVVGWMDRATATDYASLAPLVLDFAAKGDAAAHDIAADAGRGIGALIDALAARGVARIALVGGLADALRPWLPDGPRRLLVPALGDAADGAVSMARGLRAAAS